MNDKLSAAIAEAEAAARRPVSKDLSSYVPIFQQLNRLADDPELPRDLRSCAQKTAERLRAHVLASIRSGFGIAAGVAAALT